MAIRPADLQLMVQHTQEIQKNQPDAGKHQAQVNQFTQMLEKQVKQEQESVQQSLKSERENVDEDGKGGNKREKRKGDPKKKTAQKPQRRNATSMFDVSI